MLSDLLGPVLDLIAEYGLLALFIFLVLDAAMLLPVVPGELMLVLAVTRFTHDYFTLGLVVIVATVAATLGGLLLYGIARGGGRKFVEKHPRLFMMSPRRREKLERTFQRPLGQSLVFFMRLFPLARILVNLPAGLARMPLLRFIVLTALGNLIFHAGFMYIAYESRRADSAVATQAQVLRETYGAPAWEFVSVHWLLTAVAILALGILLSIKASVRMRRRPDEYPEGSLLGSLATMALFWGGVALLVGLWIDPLFVFDAMATSGYDLRDLDYVVRGYAIPYAPLSIVAAGGGAAALLGWMLSSVRRGAKRRIKRHKRAQNLITVPAPRSQKAAAPQPAKAPPVAAPDGRAPASPSLNRRMQRP